MKRKLDSISAISVSLSFVAIGQILFHWLVPKSIEGANAIYILGTFFISVSALTACLVCCKFGLGTGAPTALVSGVLGLLVMAVCTVLAVLSSSLRSCIFALSLFFPVYLMCLVPLVVSAKKKSIQDNSYSRPVDRLGRPPLPPRTV